MRKSKILLAFCLITALLFSPLAGMENHGANVIVTKEDGTLTQGELLAVKRDALVVSPKETSTGESVSVAVEDIGKVEVIKKSNVRKGAQWGFLVGGGIGAVGGLISGDSHVVISPGWFSKYETYTISAGTKAFFLGLIGAVIGSGIGLIVGASVSANKTFRFENLSKYERDSALLKLSDYAAIKGVR